ncbi:hypothetical protein LCGC14_2044300, partial [marine sediment metagenome]
MVASGMRDAGYQYIMLDEPGFRERDKDGNFIPDSKKYPSGLKALGDYIHAKGLKFGIYTDAQARTCGGFLGSYGHYEQDAKQFAAWGVDYVKADWGRDRPAEELYTEFAHALRGTGRPIYFSVIHWGMGSHHWARKAGGHTWRTTYDVCNAWYTLVDCNTGVGCLKAVDQTEALGHFAGPGGWNDPDMLVVGTSYHEKKYHVTHNGQKLPLKNDVEDRSHFSLWCLLCSPLLASNDIRTMPDVVRETLTNKEVIALNQDPLGIPAWRAQKLGDLEVWKKPLADGDIAIGLLNRGDKTARMTASWRVLDIAGRWKVRDLWAGRDLGVFESEYGCDVGSHETVVLRLSRISAADSAEAGSPLDDAVAVWHMADLTGRGGTAGQLALRGDVAVGVPLEGADRQASLARGGDGHVAQFDGGYLIAGEGAPEALHLSGDKMTFCIRLRDPAGKWDVPLFARHAPNDPFGKILYAAALNKAMVGFPQWNRIKEDKAVEFLWRTTPLEDRVHAKYYNEGKPTNWFKFVVDGEAKHDQVTEGDFVAGVLRLQAPTDLIGPDRWHDIVVRFNRAKLEMFVDGVAVD